VCDSSDLLGYDPTAFIGIILYYRLMTKWSGLGESTEFCIVKKNAHGFSQSSASGH
jgi:hypothetical protein